MTRRSAISSKPDGRDKPVYGEYRAVNLFIGVLDTPIYGTKLTMPKGYCYLLTNKKNGVLYCGVTTNLPARIFAHRQGEGSSFTSKYKVTRLVWYETYDLVTDAIQRESNIKHWRRDWKIRLIEDFNPNWNDLYDGLG